MNGTLADARRWAEGFAPLSPALEGVETVVCAPTLHLPLLHASLPESVRLGAEDVSAYTNGAHTGDVSAAMLVDAGVDWVIVGHSERRAEAGDTDERVLEKARRAAEAGVKTIVGHYYPTAKNLLVKDFYATIGFVKTAEDEAGNCTFEFTGFEDYQPQCGVMEIKRV